MRIKLNRMPPIISPILSRKYTWPIECFFARATQKKVSRNPEIKQYGNRIINEIINMCTILSMVPVGKKMFFVLIRKRLTNGINAIIIWSMIIKLVFFLMLDEYLPR